MNRRAFVLGLLATPAFAGDPTGKFKDADPRIKEWVKGLRSRAGANCCDVSDGDWAEEPQWDATRNGYTVVIDGQRVPVPDGAIIDGPNKLGRALVWPGRTASQPYVRCFMPGTLG